MSRPGTGVSPFHGLPFPVPLKYQGLILISSQRWGIPPNVLAAQLWQESRFDPNAQSDTGAEGIAQFEPGTAKANGVDPWKPSSAIDGMARLDSSYVSEFGSIDLALAAYNAGPGAVQQAGNAIPPIQQTEEYVSTIIANAKQAGSTGASGAIDTSFLHAGDIGNGPLANLTSGSTWGRIGRGALAAGLLGAGIYFVMSKEPGSFKPVRGMVNSK